MIKLSFIFIMVIIMQGCVGIDIHTLHEITYPVYNHQKQETTYTIEKLNGKPDKINKKDDGTVSWTYDRGLHFSGFVVYLIIPVLPILIPTDYHSNTYIFKDDILIETLTVGHNATFHGDHIDLR